MSLPSVVSFIRDRQFAETLYFGEIVLRHSEVDRGQVHLCIAIACCASVQWGARLQRALQGKSPLDDARTPPSITARRNSPLLHEGLARLMFVLEHHSQAQVPHECVPATLEVADDLRVFATDEFQPSGAQGRVLGWRHAALVSAELVAASTDGMLPQVEERLSGDLLAAFEKARADYRAHAMFLATGR